VCGGRFWHPPLRNNVFERITLMINPPVTAAADAPKGAPETDKPHVVAPPTQPEINPPLMEPAEVTAPNPDPAKK
jgi:hypothetical protein